MSTRHRADTRSGAQPSWACVSRDTLKFSPLLPLASVVPEYDAPGRLGALLLDVHALRPLARELDRHSREHLTAIDESRGVSRECPSDSEVGWRHGKAWWTTRKGSICVACSATFSGGGPDAWPEGMGRTLAQSGSKPPKAYGVLDSVALTALTHQGFVAAMRQRAHDTYTNGPVARASPACRPDEHGAGANGTTRCGTCAPRSKIPTSPG